MSTKKQFGSGEREIPKDKASKWYPTEDVYKPKKVRKTQHPTKLRQSLQPGTVLIILAGRFRGKRVIMLNSHDGGLLVVTGPFKVNGVPLRRVNARYVIATSTKIDISKVDVSKFDEKYFSHEKEEKKSKEEEFFKDGNKEKKEISADRTSDQSKLDKELDPIIKAVPHLKSYLKSTFSLSRGDKPHLMKW